MLKQKFLLSSTKIEFILSITQDQARIIQPWSCRICTQTNTLSTKCVKCGVEEAIEIESKTCGVCTFINSNEKSKCEMCDSFLPDAEQKIPTERSIRIRFAFRDNGSTEFYSNVKSALSTKLWEKKETRQKQKQSTKSGISETYLLEIMKDGIMQASEKNTSFANQSMSNAFTDLEALLSKASEMVSTSFDYLKRGQISSNNE